MDTPHTTTLPVPLVSVETLSVKISTGLSLLHEVSLSLHKGETVAIIGESGSGKTTLAQAIGQIYLPGQKMFLSGSVRFQGNELIGLSQKELQRFRGKHISYVFQDPLAALDPIQPIGSQIGEALLEAGLSFDEVYARVLEILTQVQLPYPEQMFWKYPHELSGGMRQRVAISAAAILRPELIIADEPTSALDAVLQAEILEILLKEVHSGHAGLLLVTHDFALVEKVATRVYVLEGGRVVEAGAMSTVLAEPRQEKTKALVSAFRRLQWS